MKYYQIIYTASETGRSGQPGFGIRTATESIPDKLLNMLDHRATTYACGSFPGVSGAKLAENPELVRTYSVLDPLIWLLSQLDGFEIETV